MGGEAPVELLVGNSGGVHVPHDANGLIDTPTVELNRDLVVVKHLGPLNGVGLDTANKVGSGGPDLVGEVVEGLLELGTHGHLEDLGASSARLLAWPGGLGPVLLLVILATHLLVEHAAGEQALDEGTGKKKRKMQGGNVEEEWGVEQGR